MSTRVKTSGLRQRAKAATPPAPAGPSIREMIRELDAEQMASAGPFDRNGSEERERQRVENENARLAEIARRAEEQRRG
jgi:hypothetical protein